MSKDVTIDVARDFGRFPAGRFRDEGRYSGQRFREEFLAEALRRGGLVKVELDGAAGYGPSFLDEAFGGLVRSGEFSCKYLESHLKICTSLQNREQMIWQEIREAVA